MRTAHKMLSAENYVYVAEGAAGAGLARPCWAAGGEEPIGACGGPDCLDLDNTKSLNPLEWMEDHTEA